MTMANNDRKTYPKRLTKSPGSRLMIGFVSAWLKGARTIVTGISEAVAETIVDLGIDWSGIETLSDSRSGLKAALRGAKWRVE
jgi:hypothetical protein